MRIPAFIHLPGAAPALAGHPADGIGQRIASRLLACLRHWHAARRTHAELARLDDATLRDIGLRRTDLPGAIEAVIRQLGDAADRRS